MGVKNTYLSYFRKNSPGRKMYGYGFVFVYKHHTLIIGIKKGRYINSKKNIQSSPQKSLEK